MESRETLSGDLGQRSLQSWFRSLNVFHLKMKGQLMVLADAKTQLMCHKTENEENCEKKIQIIYSSFFFQLATALVQQITSKINENTRI